MRTIILSLFLLLYFYSKIPTITILEKEREELQEYKPTKKNIYD